MTENLSVKQWQERVAATRRRLMGERRRVWPDQTMHTCPICSKRALQGCSDLVREVDANGAVLVFANLHGARCGDCATEFLEGYEQAAIEERAGTAFRPSIQGSVTKLGGNKLGSYWPKDVAAALGLHSQDRLHFTPLAPDTVVIRVVHEHPPEE